ncbi:MAG: galactokinase [Promethearchaeia archaeon]|nr:MAG: galactokinase [Candidatus Lokiarchaeia archaeon]
MDTEIVKKKHQEIFNSKPEIIVFAPGRVNLIGEHTDYSEGFVLPIAIDMGITVALSIIPDSEVVAVYSIDYDKKIVAMYSDFNRSQETWFNYPMGVAKILKNQGYNIGGLRITFTGNIPQGAGLSSSAALEAAVALGIKNLFNLDISRKDLAKICQKAEHEIIGVQCGIMDQYISLLAEKDKYMFLDCRSLDYEMIPCDFSPYHLIITNSNVPHKLSQSKYNERVSECMEAVKIMANDDSKKTLRDFTMEEFEKMKIHLPPNNQKRALHVISENERVLKAKKALSSGDLEAFGTLLIESHASLRDNYEVSCPELDWLVESAITIKGCVGSRMTGAGFGGCTIGLFSDSALIEYKKKLQDYETKFGYRAVIYESSPQQGARKI